jgi:hypothetical protein
MYDAYDVGPKRDYSWYQETNFYQKQTFKSTAFTVSPEIYSTKKNAKIDVMQKTITSIFICIRMPI